MASPRTPFSTTNSAKGDGLFDVAKQKTDTLGSATWSRKTNGARTTVAPKKDYFSDGERLCVAAEKGELDTVRRSDAARDEAASLDAG